MFDGETQEQLKTLVAKGRGARPYLSQPLGEVGVQRFAAEEEAVEDGAVECVDGELSPVRPR